jgi:hypothetical protein
VGAEAVLRLVARTGIVDRDPRRRRKPHAQDVPCLSEEGLLALDEQPPCPAAWRSRCRCH